MPCNITSDSPQSNHDSIKLILWYKGNEITGSPIYSIDSRNIQSNQIGLSKGTSTSSSSSKAHHFVNETIEFRAKFSESSESTGRLTINPVLESDHGMYLCRVDFKWSRTIISIVQLNVIGKHFK